MSETGQSYMAPKTYANPLFIKTSALFSSKSLLISSGACLLLAAVFWMMTFSKRAVYLLAALAVLEILFFARGLRATFDLDAMHIPQIERFVANNRGEHRLLNLIMANSAMSMKAKDIWGRDPGILGRYAEFVTYTQGGNPDKATQYMPIGRFHPLFKMLRCRYVFSRDQGGIRLDVAKDVMPRTYLVDNYRLVRNRDVIFSEMMRSTFDPRKVVILESPPDPEPVTSKEKGFLTVKDLSTDEMIIEARLPAPAILVITDAYSNGWRADALPGGVEQSYQVMPANYILRAIPLRQGRHRISLKYLPRAFEIGKWISLLSLILFVCALGWLSLRHFRRRGLNTSVSV